jgi:protoporphyrinogen oxidase
MNAVDGRSKVAVIAGAGPAGLTAALELLRRSNIIPMVFEADTQVGGISKTVNYRGNRMDLGGHRFFSKSDWVMQWWQEILPIAAGQAEADETLRITYQQASRDLLPAVLAAPASDAVMLVRRRLSRIFYRRRFFDYPLKLNADTLKNLGFVETLRIGLSYGHAQLRFRQAEDTLEQFFVNRFGNRLYRTFFKDYTEKVWGVPCREISAEWGAQRIKGLSITKAIAHAVATASRLRTDTDASQRRTETSLIERFLYPKFGPGQMWEEVARRVTSHRGAIHLRHRVIGIEHKGWHVVSVDVLDETAGAVRRIPCDHFVSTMPVRDLVTLLKPEDARIAEIASNLPYRDFMTVGLLLRKMKTAGGQLRRTGPHGTAGRGGVSENGMPPDNWIYIQEPDVRVGRLQIFNNWSPAMVADPATIWLGLEYFCAEGDDLWSMDDAKFIDFAAGELEKLGMVDRNDLLDGTVVRVPKAYPAYFGQYREFGKVRDYLSRFTNLYPVGRNGMHRYNNQDHSMLSASAAVDSILDQGRGKSDIWNVNAEEDYHEEVGKSPPRSGNGLPLGT